MKKSTFIIVFIIAVILCLWFECDPVYNSKNVRNMELGEFATKTNTTHQKIKTNDLNSLKLTHKNK